jgi:predicted RNA-binding protein with TRAM domain
MSREGEGENDQPVIEADVSSKQAERSQSPARSFSEEKPVKVGEELDVTITETSRRGDGIARIEGFVVFVPSGTQGQRARIRITSIKPNFAVAELVQPSPAD